MLLFINVSESCYIYSYKRKPAHNLWQICLMLSSFWMYLSLKLHGFWVVLSQNLPKRFQIQAIYMSLNVQATPLPTFGVFGKSAEAEKPPKIHQGKVVRFNSHQLFGVDVSVEHPNNSGELSWHLKMICSSSGDSNQILEKRILWERGKMNSNFQNSHISPDRSS